MGARIFYLGLGLDPHLHSTWHTRDTWVEPARHPKAQWQATTAAPGGPQYFLAIDARKKWRFGAVFLIFARFETSSESLAQRYLDQMKVRIQYAPTEIVPWHFSHDPMRSSSRSKPRIFYPRLSSFARIRVSKRRNLDRSQTRS